MRYAIETDLVEELCEQEGFDFEQLTPFARETLAVKLESSEAWAIEYLNRIITEESEKHYEDA